MTRARKTPARQMHVFKVVSRVKVEGERRFPYRVLGLPPEADLIMLAGAILDAFDFDNDHAFGFFDSKNPYRADVAYELFNDLADSRVGPVIPFTPGAPPADLELPDEAEIALMLTLETLDKRALLRETADFLTRRLEEQVLPRVPEHLREGVRERLTAFAAETLSMDDLEEEENFALPLPPEARALLAQPDGLEQVMNLFLAAREGVMGGELPAVPGQGREEHGLTGVPVTVPFGRQPTWTFLFDYGDDWLFDVTSQGLQDAPPRVRLPRVLETLGTAPEQYPEWEE